MVEMILLGKWLDIVWKHSIVQNTGLVDTGLKMLLKDGSRFEYDFLPVVAAVHIAWILLFVSSSSISRRR